jgi:hypothetical protein
MHGASLSIAATARWLNRYERRSSYVHNALAVRTTITLTVTHWFGNMSYGE